MRCSSKQDRAFMIHVGNAGLRLCKGGRVQEEAARGIAVRACTEDANLRNCCCPGRWQELGRFANWSILSTLQWLQKCLRMTTAAASYPKKIRKLSRCPASALVLRAPARCPLSFLLRRDLEAWICPALYPSLSSG